MTIDWNGYLLPLFLFALAMTGSPGPNNLMLTASGANFGFRRTIPHILGIMLGMVTMLLSIAAGLGVLFEQWPVLHQLLRVCGALFLFFLAWRIATAAQRPVGTHGGGRPLNLWQALAFQYVNPKAWMINISSVATFCVTGPDYWQSALIIAGVYLLVMSNTLPFWTGFGVLVGRLLATERANRYFNWVMALLTAGSVVIMLE